MVRSNFDPAKAGASGEVMVEVIGQDGLRHHVGPFKSHADAQAWIAENPSDSTSQTASRDRKPEPRRSARIVE